MVIPFYGVALLWLASPHFKLCWDYSIFRSVQMKKTIASTAITLFWIASQVSAGGHMGTIDYAVGEKNFKAHIAAPEGTSKGTVYIIHDWDGLNDYEKKRAGMIADLGFTAVALDLFGTDAQLNGMDDYRRETGALYQNRAEFRARIDAGVRAAQSAVSDAEKEVLIGYCFGGAAVLEAARAGMDLDGFVSFHGGLSTPEGQDYSQAKGPVLMLHGSADPVSGLDVLASVMGEMRDAGIEHQAEIYGGARHSFTIEGSRDYDPDAEAKSWDAFLRFLAR